MSGADVARRPCRLLTRTSGHRSTFSFLLFSSPTAGPHPASSYLCSITYCRTTEPPRPKRTSIRLLPCPFSNCGNGATDIDLVSRFRLSPIEIELEIEHTKLTKIRSRCRLRRPIPATSVSTNPRASFHCLLLDIEHLCNPFSRPGSDGADAPVRIDPAQPVTECHYLVISIYAHHPPARFPGRACQLPLVPLPVFDRNRRTTGRSTPLRLLRLS